MIDAEPSLDAAERVSGPALQAYLVARGWTARPARVPGMSILSKRTSSSEQVVEILLPVTQDFGDEKRRVADALRSVAAIEGLSEACISEDVRLFKSNQGRSAAVGVGRPPGKLEAPPDWTSFFNFIAPKPSSDLRDSLVGVYELYWYPTQGEDTREKSVGGRWMMRAFMQISDAEHGKSTLFKIVYPDFRTETHEIEGVVIKSNDILYFIGLD